MSSGDSEQLETAVPEQADQSQQPEAANLTQQNNQADNSEIPQSAEQDQQADTADTAQQGAAE